MSTAPQIPILERPAFFTQQRLEPDDFATMFAHPRGVRWLHNRTLHGWGIGAGFEVLAKKGDRFVSVAPGYAIDCLGHDLVLSETKTLVVPQVAGPKHYRLTTSYIDDDNAKTLESRDGVCPSNGAVRKKEEPNLRWQDPDDVTSDGVFRPGIDLVLAEVDVQDCRLVSDPDRSNRRDLVARMGAYVASGTSPSPGTAWETVSHAGSVVGVRATIDTTSGGFRRPPLYFAGLVGEHSTSGSPFMFDGPLTVSDEKAESFRATIYLPSGAQLGGRTLNPSVMLNSGLPSLVGGQLGWGVAWIGVET